MTLLTVYRVHSGSSRNKETLVSDTDTNRILLIVRGHLHSEASTLESVDNQLIMMRSSFDHSRKTSPGRDFLYEMKRQGDNDNDFVELLETLAGMHRTLRAKGQLSTLSDSALHSLTADILNGRPI